VLDDRADEVVYGLVCVGLAAFETDDVLTVTGRAQNRRPFA
jgi:hypothetical protein